MTRELIGTDGLQSVPHETVVDLFERQVAATIGAVAVVDGDRSLTYGQLNRLADRIAGRILACCPQRPEAVGLFLGRGIELLAAMIGILKTGAAYVPFDLADPDDRLRSMAADVGLDVLITDGQRAFPLEEHHELAISRDWAQREPGETKRGP